MWDLATVQSRWLCLSVSVGSDGFTNSLPVHPLAQQQGIMRQNECSISLYSWCPGLFDNTLSWFSSWAECLWMTGLWIAQARVKNSFLWALNHKAFIFPDRISFLPTSCRRFWGLSTPGSCTFWAFEPGQSAPTLWWSSSSPYQTKARTTSGAWACLVDWTEAWTASTMKRWEKNTMRWEAGVGGIKGTRGPGADIKSQTWWWPLYLN